jgi:hypothetical protein
MFFGNSNDYLFIDSFTYPFENIGKNSNSHDTQNMYMDSQNTFLGIFGSLILISGMVYAGSSMNRQEHKIYDNMWDRQREEEKFYQRIYSDRNRNHYQNDF